MTDVLSGVSSGAGAPSAQTDRFVHDRLPPRDQWPDLRYDRPELQIPDAANLVATLLGGAHARGWGERCRAYRCRLRCAQGSSSGRQTKPAVPV